MLGIIIPTDELIFFRGIGQPPTRAGCCVLCCLRASTSGGHNSPCTVKWYRVAPRHCGAVCLRCRVLFAGYIMYRVFRWSSVRRRPVGFSCMASPFYLKHTFFGHQNGSGGVGANGFALPYLPLKNYSLFGLCPYLLTKQQKCHWCHPLVLGITGVMSYWWYWSSWSPKKWPS